MAENRGGLSPTTFMGRSQEDTATMKVLASNQASFDAINVQLARISTQMGQFNNSLTRISELISESSALERVKEQQQINQERILAEQKLREGKESIVERKIQTSLATPIQKVGAKAQGTLGNLMRFFTSLLSGWLLIQGIQALKAYSEGNRRRLQDIGKTIVKGLAIAGAIFGSIKLGLTAATGSILRAGSFISQAVFSGLFKRPVQALISAVRGVKIPGLGGGPKKVPPSAKQNPLRKAGNILSSSPGGRISGALAGIYNLFQGKSPGESAAGAAATGLGAAALARVPLGPLSPLRGVAALFLLPQFNQLGIQGHNIAKQYFSNNTINFSGLDVGKKVGGIGNLFSAGTDNKESHKADIVATPAAQISLPPKSDVSSSIGPEPDQTTRVVLTDAATDQQPQSVPSTTGNIADLPAIASSNPDNFYVMYSQVHYNVVI